MNCLFLAGEDGLHDGFEIVVDHALRHAAEEGKGGTVILHEIAALPQNREASRGQVLRLAAERLYQVMYGRDDFETARAKVGNETDKDCLRARIDALYRRIEREQAAIDYLYILAVQDAYETCHDVEHIIGDEAYTDHDVEQYNNLLAVADQLYCVLPQGPHPSFDSGWRIKVRRNKGERKR